MTDYGVTPQRTLSPEEKEALQSVLDQNFTKGELLHLKHIFKSQTKKIAWYYGDNETTAGNRRELAEALVREYPDEVEDLLYDLDNLTVKKNKFEENLVSEGVPGYLVDELEPTTRQLLVFAYHELYDEDDFSAKLEFLILDSRLFKETTERTYKYDRDRFDLENFEAAVRRHVRRRNDELYRPFTIRYHETDDTIFLDFYKETARVMQNIFKQRKKDEVAPSDNPTVTHESGYTIKTLLCRVDTSADDEVKFVFKTDPQSSWNGEMERFFEAVAGIEDPFDETNQEVDDGASEVLDTAVSTAQGNEKDISAEEVEEVEDAVTETMEDLAGDSLPDDAPAISEGNVQWVGWVVDNDEDTMIVSDDFTAATNLVNFVKNTPGAGENLFHILSEAEKGNIGLRFRSDFGDGNNETFIVRSKFWTEEKQVDEQARNLLSAVFKGGEDAE